MHRILAAIALLLASSHPLFADDYPSVVIKNDRLKFTLYEADATKGFYRGTRFVHAGVFGNVEFAGHKIFGPWKDTHDPTNHDDIIGPCEEFGITSPLGYAEAKVGETFLKIGVGELEKPKEVQYSFANKYKIVKPLKWKREEENKNGEQRITWTTSQEANGYGYEFSKSIVLRKRVIALEYSLKNTGRKRIVTDFYNHNFFNVDGDPIGPNYSLVFPFEPKAKDLKGKFGDLVELKEKEFRFKDKLPTGDFVMAGLTGYDPQDKTQRSFEMWHAPSGVYVEAWHTYPFAKFNVWGIKTTICPEPYLALDLEPDREKAWTINYGFHHSPQKK